MYMMSQRMKIYPEESMTSNITILSEAAARADDFASRFAQVEPHDDPTISLRRWLSNKSVISTSSSFAERHQAALSHPNLQVYRQIGRGGTGVVFEVPGQDRIIKKAISDGVIDNLWHDFTFGNLIGDKFRAAASWETRGLKVPRAPQYMQYCSPEKIDFAEWEQTKRRFPDAHQTPTSFLWAERILPLPKPVREALIDKYCLPTMAQQAKIIQGNKDCLARLYLGRRRRENKFRRFFSLRNFQIHLDQALEICPEEILRYAEEMGCALAVMHWLANCDANDVEFVLGSAPTLESFRVTSTSELWQLPVDSVTLPTVKCASFPKRAVHLWVLDFDKVQRMEHNKAGIAQAIKAAEENDPYYPKPASDKSTTEFQLWDAFGRAYLDASKNFIQSQDLQGCDGLPAAFLNGWQAYRARKLEGRAVS